MHLPFKILQTIYTAYGVIIPGISTLSHWLPILYGLNEKSMVWYICGQIYFCIWHPNVSVSTPYLTLDLECCVCIIRVVNGWVDRSNKGGEKKRREMKPGDKSRDWQPGEYLISIDNSWNISSLLYRSQWQPCQFNGCFITGDGPSRTISAQYQCMCNGWHTKLCIEDF